MIFYKIVLSGKNNEIQIDEDELQDVLESINKGGLVLCKQGLFNPAYLIAIKEDFERWQEWNNSTDRGNIEKLKNYFPDEKIAKRLGEGGFKKLIN